MIANNHASRLSRNLLVLALLGLGCPLLHAAFTKGTEQPALTPQLKAGDYVWKPQISPSGPVVIIVSLPKQCLYVYRNGVRIGHSTISSGKSGHQTPTGVFTILQKNVEHESSIYKGASMPYMQRLTWSGIAMHAGQLPGYPASHGCVRLPLDFAQKLYSVTSKGVTVIVTDEKVAPGETSRPGLLLSGKTGERRPLLAGSSFMWEPEKAPDGPVSILFSSADDQAYIYRSGIEIGRAAIVGKASKIKFGSYAYTALAEINPDGSRVWQALGSADGDSDAPDLKELAKDMVFPPNFITQVRSVVVPGTTLIITDHSANGTMRSGTDFSILTASAQR